MALSGSNYTTFSTYYRVQLEWSATQNYANNTSLITVRLYLVSTNSAAGISASSSRTVSITVDGTTDSKTESGILNLSGGQKKLIHTTQKTVNHDSQGRASVGLSASVPVNLSLGGGSAGTVNVSLTANLNDIPRQSSLASSADLKAGDNWGISINRASSAYTHEVRLYVDGEGITTVTNVGASTTYVFTVAEVQEMYQVLSGKTSGETRIEVRTYSGSTQVGGVSTHYGTMTKPSTSYISDSPTQAYVGESIPFTITRSSRGFTHSVSLVRNGVSYKTMSGFEESGVFTTSDIDAALHNAIGNASYANFGLVIETFYHGVSVGPTNTAYIRLLPASDPPIFAGNFTYADTNSSVTSVTGNNQYIVRGKSKLTVTLPTSAKATGQNGATIVRYDAAFGGITRSANETSGTITFTFDKPNVSSNAQLTVTAVDSRGKTTTRSKTVNVANYADPRLTAKGRRNNGFDDATTLTTSGFLTPVTIGSSNVNSLQTLRYRYRLTTSSTFGSWISIPFTQTSTSFSGSNRSLTLPNTNSYVFEVEAVDQFGSITRSFTVTPGKPLFFIDDLISSVGVNKFPNSSNAFEVGGDLRVDNSIYGSSLNVTGTVRADSMLETSGTFRLAGSSSLYDTEMTTSSSGLTIYPRSSTGYFRISGSSTSYMYLRTNRPQFRFDSDVQAPNVIATGDLTAGDDVYVGDRIYLSGTTGYGYTKSSTEYEFNFDRRIAFSSGGNNGGISVGSSSGGDGLLFGRRSGSDATSMFKWSSTGLMVRTSSDSGYASLQVSSLVEHSERSDKTDIKPMGATIDKVRQTPVHDYKRVNPEEGREHERQIGLMMDEAPPEIVVAGGIDMYSMVAFLWKAVQELAGVVENGLTPQGLNDPEKAAEAAKETRKALSMLARGLSEEDALAVASVYPEWQDSNVKYKKDDIVRYADKLYRVVSNHTSQSAWTPDAAPSLFSRIAFAEDGTAVWIQPTGAHDAYKKGAVVTHNGKTWTSDVNGNVWEPGVYGWTENK